ncbi:MAG: TrkA family potassium uptake protein [Plectolyngbya sp. WJT66-NPBG17]|jgi:trk system potassium uptake protein TrkA|nr:TrkA family potassium uptake protein [Plectolyngbya sp. WJT66-NPBG17]MBW4526262.1 TrkA family potassium uptake protein [Phormidium tanganyikae FI6-MK23]
MYVLIGGAGMMGLDLAQQLLKLGHTVAVIDIDPLACRFAREKIGVMAFEGSAVSTTVLLEAGIRQANAIVAALRDDALNLALITLSRSYGISHIVVRMRDREFLEAYRLAQASHIISTVDLAVATMANAIEYPQVESMMHFEQGQVEVLKLPISGDCYVAGQTIAEIAQDPHFPNHSLIIGYQCHACANLEIPNGNTVLQAGSTILVVTRPEFVHQIIDYLGIQLVIFQH